jgi:KDO2-lipid IV(A) lauroyltransferase
MVIDNWSSNLKKSGYLQKGLVLVTAHLGNYELAGSYLASYRLPVHAVVEDIPGHTSSYERIRRSFGMGTVSYADIQGMIRILRSGGILVMLADRDLSSNGVTVDFGKGKRKVPVGPAMLALRTGARLQTGYLVLERQAGKYRCVINPCFEVEREGSLKRRIEITTRGITERLVAAIRAYPDQWFVFQDEWN